MRRGDEAWRTERFVASPARADVGPRSASAHRAPYSHGRAYPSRHLRPPRCYASPNPGFSMVRPLTVYAVAYSPACAFFGGSVLVNGGGGVRGLGQPVRQVRMRRL